MEKTGKQIEELNKQRLQESWTSNYGDKYKDGAGFDKELQPDTKMGDDETRFGAIN